MMGAFGAALFLCGWGCGAPSRPLEEPGVGYWELRDWAIGTGGWEFGTGVGCSWAECLATGIRTAVKPVLNGAGFEA